MTMDDHAIAERLKPLFAEAFPDADADKIGPETTANDVVGWDSMAHVGLMAAIEDEFAVQFEPEEVTSSANVGGLIALVARKVNGA